jgi:hypothetical protein
MLLVFNPEDKVSQDYPLTRIKLMADERPEELSSAFQRMCSQGGFLFLPASFRERARLFYA